MKSKWFILLLVTAVLLASCSQAAAPTQDTAAKTLEAAATQLAELQAATAQPAGTQPAENKATATPAGGKLPGGCVAGNDPLPLPPITAEDWSTGPADASVTILEYSDFQ
jgi:hypothetical protein